MTARIDIVSTFDRPDLAPLTARWRWEAFYADDGTPLEAVVEHAVRMAADPQLMPQTLVLLEDGVPVGTASLTAHDMDDRPDLTPWLAGLYVQPASRGRGHAVRLVAAVERLAAEAGIAVLWLFTQSAAGLYDRLGWTTAETLVEGDRTFVIMRRALAAS